MASVVSDEVLLHHRRYLSPPCTNSLSVENLNFETKDLLLEITKVMKFFADRYKMIEGNANVELAILAQFLYKNHNRFRNDKCQRFLKMIQKSASRFLGELDLDKLVSKFNDVLPIPMDINNKDKLYLPTRQMLEFLLVRLYGGANLLWKLIVYCQNAGELCVQRIKLGHFWNIGLNNLSCVSRLWTLSISMLVLVEKAYKCFLLLLPILPVSQVQWLAMDCNYNFPKNISNAILVDEQPSCESFLEKFKNIVNNDNFPKFVNILADPDEVKQQIDVGLSVDIGEVISREDLLDTIPIANKPAPITNSTTIVKQPNIGFSKENSQSKPTQLDIPCSNKKWAKLNDKTSNHTKNSKTLQLFVQEENKLRKTDRNIALTKTLGQDQWKALRGEINTYIEQIKKLGKDKRKKENELLKKCKNLIMYWILYPCRKGTKPENWSKICAYYLNNGESRKNNVT